jgi:pimeloyl-ACP methyl ester carboxylesterase
MPHVVNGGCQIAFDVTGRGTGIGFLLPQRKVGWDRMGYVDALAARDAKVLVVDPRGYGDSSRCRAADGYSVDGFCDDLLAAADAVGLERFVAWGYSNTAALCVALAVRTDRCVGVACCGMEPFLDFTAPLAHFEAEARAVGEGEYLPDGGFDWRAALAFSTGYTADQRRFPERLPCPGVVVHGADDGLVAGSVLRHEARIRAFGLEIVSIPDLDHASCVEAADAVIAAVDTVLDLPKPAGERTVSR